MVMLATHRTKEILRKVKSTTQEKRCALFTIKSIHIKYIKKVCHMTIIYSHFEKKFLLECKAKDLIRNNGVLSSFPNNDRLRIEYLARL